MENFEITNPVYLVNKASSVDRVYGPYENMATAIESMRILALPGRLFGVQTADGVALYIYQGGTSYTEAGGVFISGDRSMAKIDGEWYANIDEVEEQVIKPINTTTFPITVTTNQAFDIELVSVVINGSNIPKSFITIVDTNTYRISDYTNYINTIAGDLLIVTRFRKYIL